MDIRKRSAVPRYRSMHSKGTASLLKRLLFVLLGMLVYRWGNFIPLPGIDFESSAETFKRLRESGNFFTNLDKISGSSWAQGSIFALGIQPYIISSMMMRLLSSAIPRLKEMQREDVEGRNRIHQAMRMGTILIASVIALTRIFSFRGDLNFLYTSDATVELALTARKNWMYAVIFASLVAWSTFVMWMAEQLTEVGIGNGTSIMILSSQLSRLPRSMTSIWSAFWTQAMTPLALVAYGLVLMALLYCIAFFEKTTRKITIHFAERKMLQRHGVLPSQTALPIKFNVADIMPLMMSGILLDLIQWILGLTAGRLPNILLLQKLQVAFQANEPLYAAVNVLTLIVTFYAYAGINFDCREVSEDLKRDNGCIEGIRPGVKTANYLEVILEKMVRMSLIYQLILAIVLPIGFRKIWGEDYTVSTFTLLLTVSIIMDMLENVVTHIYSYRYESILKQSSFWNLKKQAR